MPIRRLAGTLGTVLLLTTAASWLLVRWAAVVDADRWFAHLSRADLVAPDLSGALGIAFQWAIWVTALALACWLATRAARRRWLPAAVAGTAIIAWAVRALINGVGVSWPGPAAPHTTSPEGYTTDYTLDHPGALSVVVLLAAVVGTAVSAAMTPRVVVPSPRGGVRAAALLVTVGPAAGLCLGTSVLLTVDMGSLSYLGPALHPIATSAVLLGAAAVASGSGRAALALLVGAAVVLVQPLAGLWASGGPDVLLLAAVGSVVGAALSWAWRPLARSLRSLTVDRVPAAP